MRGPQSALWGSEAIGGVIAVNGLDDAPGYARKRRRRVRSALRAPAAPARSSTDRASLSGAVGFQRATGINSVAGPGDKDGYRNLSGRLRATWHPRADVEIGASALALTGRTEFDGFDPFTGAHADTLDSSRNRLSAGRVWASVGSDASPWRGAGRRHRCSARRTGIILPDVEQNRTRGTRRNLSAQLERRLRDRRDRRIA